MLTATAQARLYYLRKRNRSATLVDDLGQPGWGTMVFATNPSNAQTIALGGTTVTFGSDVTIGASLAITLASLLTFLQASVNAGIRLATYSVEGSTLVILSRAPGNNTMALAASNATVSHSTLLRQQNRERRALGSETL